MQLLGPGNWFGFQAVDGLDVAVIDLTIATATVASSRCLRTWIPDFGELSHWTLRFCAAEAATGRSSSPRSPATA